MRVSPIKCSCVIKEFNQYSWQISNLKFAKRVLPEFSESLKGMVLEIFSGITPQTPHFRVLALPLHESKKSDCFKNSTWNVIQFFFEIGNKGNNVVFWIKKNTVNPPEDV